MKFKVTKTKFLIAQIACFFLSFPVVLYAQNSQSSLESHGLEWFIASMIKDNNNNVQINGHPHIVNVPNGEAVYFNGVEDALFLDENPLENFEEFTVEMIFNPEINAPFEQRVLHIGEVSSDRMLLEIRAINNHWYFDGFVASGDSKLALIDETLLHPLGKWCHVALVVTKNNLSTYVNGKLELMENFSFKPIRSGKTSIGVRLNKRSWFKGSIYKIKVSPKKLEPDDFMGFELKNNN
ncbi:MAG TPA: LamG-like jellyroll fold domain-containing protein [Mariniflexile sp.]